MYMYKYMFPHLNTIIHINTLQHQQANLAPQKRLAIRNIIPPGAPREAPHRTDSGTAVRCSASKPKDETEETDGRPFIQDGPNNHREIAGTLRTVPLYPHFF